MIEKMMKSISQSGYPNSELPNERTMIEKMMKSISQLVHTNSELPKKVKTPRGMRPRTYRKRSYRKHIETNISKVWVPFKRAE